jgi:hypothetical protein
MTPTGRRYLDLLARVLTGTLFDEEPDHDNANATAFAVAFARHYVAGGAITMLPLVRLANIRDCVETLLAEAIPGDLIETGVWRGGASIYMRACLEAAGDQARRVFLADSFQGLPEPDPGRPKEAAFHHSPVMQKLYKRMAATLEDVRANFAAFDLLDDRVVFLEGWFKDTLPTAPIDRLALLRLDGDYYDSTMEALTALYPKLSPGGFVIVDDYGEDAWTDCRAAVEDYRTANAIAAPVTWVDRRCAWWRKG